MQKHTNLWHRRFVHSDQFYDPEFVRTIEAYDPATATEVEGSKPAINRDEVSGLTAAFFHPLLTPEGEWKLFMKMNLAKFKASQLEDDEPGEGRKLVAHVIDGHVATAMACRKFIFDHNLRLIVSLSKKQKRPEMELGDFIANASFAVLNSIDRFDANKVVERKTKVKVTGRQSFRENGVRFGTYASWAISRQFWQDYSKRDRMQDAILTVATGGYDRDQDVYGIDVPDRQAADPSDLDDEFSLVSEALNDLPPRERATILGQFGIGGEEHTLDTLGHKMGVSKERVRQLKTAGLFKLRLAVGAPVGADLERERLASIAKKKSWINRQRRLTASRTSSQDRVPSTARE